LIIKQLDIDLTIDRIIHLGLFGVVMLNYTFLLFSNPGEITNEFNTTLMVYLFNLGSSRKQLNNI
jgi:hypothetical protein